MGEFRLRASLRASFWVLVFAGLGAFGELDFKMLSRKLFQSGFSTDRHLLRD